MNIYTNENTVMIASWLVYFTKCCYTEGWYIKWHAVSRRQPAMGLIYNYTDFRITYYNQRRFPCTYHHTRPCLILICSSQFLTSTNHTNVHNVLLNWPIVRQQLITDTAFVLLVAQCMVFCSVLATTRPSVSVTYYIITTRNNINNNEVQR